MSHKRLWVAATIIAVVILVGFILSVPHTRDLGKPPSQDVKTQVPTVSLRDVFKKGVHTITGSMKAPNACTTVTAQASLSDETSGTGGILVQLSFSEDSGVCLQVPTTVSFSTTISAPARLPLSATVNGAIATTTVS